MKVLFAVSNDEISEAIVKRYQKEYKEIISYKNVYYFNAILKEIQKDKTYDRIIISEDLEAFTHTQYEQIDKFIFEKLDNISDEASTLRGEDIPIILICSDRRAKSEDMLVKLFGIGIYNAVIGNDRSVEEICNLIRRPRLKKEAKAYYRIESDDVKYQSESENDVSEQEIQNILAHYKKLGKDEDKYVVSFNNIVAQYNDAQLRIISKFLPLNVRAVLEEKSPKYQQIMSFNNAVSNNIRKKSEKEEDLGPSGKLLKPKNKNNIMTGPIVVPSSVNVSGVKKLSRNVSRTPENQEETTQIGGQGRTSPNIQQPVQPVIPYQYAKQQNTQIQRQQVLQENDMQEYQKYVEPIENIIQEEPVVEQPKRRGRPKKVSNTNIETEPNTLNQQPKRRGRPRKNPTPEPVENANDGILPGLENTSTNSSYSTDNSIENNILPGFEEDSQEGILPGFEDNNTNVTTFSGVNNEPKENDMLPGFDEEDSQDGMLPGFEDSIQENMQNNMSQNSANSYSTYNSNNYNKNTSNGYDSMNGVNSYNQNNSYNSNTYENYSNLNNVSAYQQDSYQTSNNVDLSGLLTNGKKIATFVGTSKNGTSFILNNLAEYASSMGINVAILDTTKNKNSYYIYTKNEEELRKVAANSLENLIQGQAKGINVNRNLTVYTSLPSERDSLENVGPILETLVRSHNLVLIDCDFDTPIGYFDNAQEIYLVQSLDVLTIQPLTAFLRELKAKNVLDQNKIKIILNKYVKVRGISEKTIIGGMAFYNDPAMSFMTELFDRNVVKYISIPFEQDIYTRYLESVINCDISIKGYSKTFMQVLKELSNMVYPMVPGNNTYRPQAPTYNAGFSTSMNNTLNQMKRKY